MYRKDINMPIILVIAKYNKKDNVVAEHHIGKTFSIKKAENWLNNTDKPAMFYVDGMQNHDAFLTMFCLFNKKYWIEHKKEID